MMDPYSKLRNFITEFAPNPAHKKLALSLLDELAYPKFEKSVELAPHVPPHPYKEPDGEIPYDEIIKYRLKIGNSVADVTGRITWEYLWRERERKDTGYREFFEKNLMRELIGGIVEGLDA